MPPNPARFQIKLHKDVTKFLRRLPPREANRIREKIDLLGENPFDRSRLDIKPMQGVAGLWQLRVGGYRLIYEVRDDILVVFILTAGSRGDVYK